MDLELYSLTVFQEVMSAGSFSAAARNLRLSQPAVSQHVARLESRLKIRLFQRVGREVVPTDGARRLLDLAHRVDSAIRDFGEGLNLEQEQLTGRVRYAMPESCQWTPHYRKIMSQLAAFPGIEFEIGIETRDEIARGIADARLDFGFVLGERSDPDLRFEKFSDEPYVASARDPREFSAFADPSQLRLIAYPGWELFFETWARAHGLSRKLARHEIHPVVRVGTLAGALHAAQEGVGVGIFPAQCVMLETRSRPLVIWKEDAEPRASLPIYLATRRGETLPKRVTWVIEKLREAKKEVAGTRG